MLRSTLISRRLMAFSAEISVAASLSFAKGALADLFQVLTTKFDMTGSVYERRSFAVPTTAGGTALPLGDITTPGWCFMRNNDPTNFITVLNATSGNAVIKLKAGEFACFRFGTSTPAVLANTAIVSIDYLLLQD